MFGGLFRGAYALLPTAKAGGLPRCYRCDDRQQERDSRLWELFRELKRLRDEMLKAGESLRLGGTLDVDGDVATVRDIESEIRRADNRNVRR